MLDTDKKISKGIHIIADFFECQIGQDLMLNAALLEKICRDLVQKSGLIEVNYIFHQFQNSGVTGVVLLSESHLSIHTWPEINYLNLDIFVCNFNYDNTQKAKALFHSLVDIFQPKHIDKHELERK